MTGRQAHLCDKCADGGQAAAEAGLRSGQQQAAPGAQPGGATPLQHGLQTRGRSRADQEGRIQDSAAQHQEESRLGACRCSNCPQVEGGAYTALGTTASPPPPHLQPKVHSCAQHVGGQRARRQPRPLPRQRVVPLAQPPSQYAAAGRVARGGGTVDRQNWPAATAAATRHAGGHVAAGKRAPPEGRVLDAQHASRQALRAATWSGACPAMGPTQQAPAGTTPRLCEASCGPSAAPSPQQAPP